MGRQLVDERIFRQYGWQTRKRETDRRIRKESRQNLQTNTQRTSMFVLAGQQIPRGLAPGSIHYLVFNCKLNHLIQIHLRLLEVNFGAEPIP